ncbi:uncharacterized protein LOC135825714 [Sycon ciliatum]|uniref:uncharacterized protein LOC135825714 n=1 Tax=Sycon ciliatum TaxID=27933 RepID=UPI0031F720CE
MLNFYTTGQAELEAYVTSRIMKVPTCLPPRRQQNLRTFAPATKRKRPTNQKEKDHKLVTNCLKQRLTWIQTQRQEASDGLADQLIPVPRSLTSDGLKPRTGSKSTAAKQYQDRYSDVIVPHLPSSFVTTNTAVIIDAMFIINTSPLAVHQGFGDYAKFVLERWAAPWYKRSVGSVHFIFDNGTALPDSPKAILQDSRDAAAGGNDVDHDHIEEITTSTTLPRAWRKFLGCRRCKRALCSFISQYCLGNASGVMATPNQCFVTAGALPNQMGNLAVGCIKSATTCFAVRDLESNAEEADYRIWLHASKFDSVLVYSPDTDVYHIGMALEWLNTGDRSVFVQLDMPGSMQHKYMSLTKLAGNIRNDPDLSQVPEDVRVAAVQALFVCSGCDFVSFFAGLGKCSFYKAFFQFATFITGGVEPGLLAENNEDSFFAFVRLVGTTYYQKHKAAFDANGPYALYKQFGSQEKMKQHEAWLNAIRDAVWQRTDTEDDCLPSTTALNLHWKRSQWVLKVWKQAPTSSIVYPRLEDHGWLLREGVVSVQWDTEEHMAAVHHRVATLTKGCHCKFGCNTRRCKCRKANGLCGPGCKCHNCQNMPSATTSSN